jgi:hypothetical protein
MFGSRDLGNLGILRESWDKLGHREQKRQGIGWSSYEHLNEVQDSRFSGF